MSFVITIGREYGSGGRYIGEEIARKLGINFYDSKLLEKASEEFGYDLNFIEQNDEKKEKFFGFSYNYLSNEIMSSSQRVATAQFAVIEKLAKTESCVIIARCSNYILRDYDNVINIFIYAPMEDKIKRATKFYNIDEKKAEETINKINKERAAYYNFYSNRKWGHKDNYDMCINSSIGIKETADLIINLVKNKFPNEQINIKED